MSTLQPVWMQLAGAYSADEKLAVDLWHEIETAYSAPGRHYHNLDHIRHMHLLAVEYQHLLKEPDAVLFAIFYHDIIYRPGRSTNEKKSADLAARRLRALSVPAEVTDIAVQQILATQHHQPSADPDTNYLLDMDLAVLGESPERYARYAAGIRKEFGMFPDIIYNSGRKKVLKHFLDMDTIFKTPAFRSVYEERARINLQAELAGL